MSVTAKTTDYSVALINDGLGPALIKNAVYYIDGQCVYLESPDHKEFMADNYEKVVKRIAQGFIALIDATKWDGKFQSTRTFEGAAPTPRQILGVDKEIVLYRMTSEFAKEFHSRLWSLGGGHRTAL